MKDSGGGGGNNLQKVKFDNLLFLNLYICLIELPLKFTFLIK